MLAPIWLWKQPWSWPLKVLSDTWMEETWQFGGPGGQVKVNHCFVAGSTHHYQWWSVCRWSPHGWQDPTVPTRTAVIFSPGKRSVYRQRICHHPDWIVTPLCWNQCEHFLGLWASWCVGSNTQARVSLGCPRVFLWSSLAGYWPLQTRNTQQGLSSRHNFSPHRIIASM